MSITKYNPYHFCNSGTVYAVIVDCLTDSAQNFKVPRFPLFVQYKKAPGQLAKNGKGQLVISIPAISGQQFASNREIVRSKPCLSNICFKDRALKSSVMSLDRDSSFVMGILDESKCNFLLHFAST